MNKHIEENIKYYLSLKNPEYAILLKGKWGSGKTYFINNYIKENSLDRKKEIKFIKISLFGLKSTNSIDEQIFHNLHPILGSKYAKLLGNVAKSAFKLGIKLDWKGDDKADGNVTADLNNFNLLDFFSDENNTKDIVFIFDDLERTEIDQQEVLGYINYLIEQSGFKVIIIANEERIYKLDCKKVYNDFKEKVIGKTYEVRHVFPDVLKFFLSETPEAILINNRSIIEEIHKNSGYNNLRHIKQTILDFKYIISLIEDEFLNNGEFIQIFISNFFCFSVEHKHGFLKENHLKSYNRLLGSLIGSGKDVKEVPIVDKIFKKYNLSSELLLSGGTWIKIIFKNYIDKEELNKNISGLSFFTKEKERPSWVNLWHYRELEEDDFEKNIQDVIEKFKSCKYERPEIFLHAISILIFFNKNNLSDFDIKQIQKTAENCISKYRSSNYWKENLFERDLRFNGTGLGYIDYEDTDFNKILKIVADASKQIYVEKIDTTNLDNISLFLDSIKSGNIEFIHDFLLKNYDTQPILKDLSSSEFVNILTESKNEYLSRLFEIISSRYADNKYYNNKHYYLYLVDELDFWKGVRSQLENIKVNSLKDLILKEFSGFVETIIKRLTVEDS